MGAVGGSPQGDRRRAPRRASLPVRPPAGATYRAGAPWPAVLVAVLGLLALVAVAPASVGVASARPPGPGPTDGPAALAGPLRPAVASTGPRLDAARVPPLARLGRWDGRGFVPVAPGSLDAEVVTVISHGWSPGYRARYDALQARTDQLVTAWDPALVNSAGQSMMEAFTPLAAALAEAAPDSDVVAFSWMDQSSTGDDPLEVRSASEATEVNGHRLAVALEQALAPGFHDDGGQVHLIGHSFGARVVSVAATALGHPPRQVTLLDSPEVTLARLGGAMNGLRYVLPRLDVGRGPDQVFVDNYVSALGEAYHPRPGLGEVVDVRTRPPDEGVAARHGFAVYWYADSVRDPSAGVGYAWSPLAGGEVSDLGAQYRQVDVDRPLVLEEVAGRPDSSDLAPLPVRTEPARRGDDPTVGAASERTAAAAGGDVVVGGGAGPSGEVVVTTAGDSLWLELDLRLEGRPGDLVTVAVDGRARLQAAVPADGGDGDGGTGEAPTYVTLVDVAPGDHVVTVSLGDGSGTGPADASTTATASDLRIASTDGIVRNLTPRQTDELVLAVTLAAALLAVGLALALATGVRHLARRRRSAAPGPVDPPDPTPAEPGPAAGPAGQGAAEVPPPDGSSSSSDGSPSPPGPGGGR